MFVFRLKKYITCVQLQGLRVSPIRVAVLFNGGGGAIPHVPIGFPSVFLVGVFQDDDGEDAARFDDIWSRCYERHIYFFDA